MYVSSQVDSQRLRSTLDELRKAVAARGPVQVAHSAALAPVPQSQMLDALHAVLRKASKDELGRIKDQCHVSVLGRAPGSTEMEQRLGETLRALSKAMRERLGDILGREKITALSELLKKPVPDFLAVIQKPSDENAHSDVIRWLLSPRKAPNVAKPALLALVSGFENAHEWRTLVERAIASRTLAVRREYVFGREWEDSDELSRLDLFISGPGFALAVENKLLSREHQKQTTKYWEWLRSLGGLRAGIFLTPTGHAAQSSEFRTLSYLGLLSALLEGSSRGKISEREELVLASYVKSLGASVLRREIQLIEREAA